MKRSVVSRDPEVMGGTPVFSGTRVPIQTFIEYLEAGDSIDQFLEGFPSVTREQVVAFLEEAKDKLVASVSLGSFSTKVLTGDCRELFAVTMSRLFVKRVGLALKTASCLR
jgi:uncharacterized protein (DUF433 family)